MEPYYAGILSLLPPVIAITLALITKEVISSLLVGILTGTLIYSLNTGLNPIVGTVDITFKLMTQRMDVSILLFLALLGALVVVVSMAGGSRAYGRWASEKLRSKRSAQLATSAQLPDRRHRDEAGHRQIWRFARQARLHHRRNSRTGLHHRAGFKLGGSGRLQPTDHRRV